jgi:hypothetical protein
MYSTGSCGLQALYCQLALYLAVEEILQSGESLGEKFRSVDRYPLLVYAMFGSQRAK